MAKASEKSLIEYEYSKIVPHKRAKARNKLDIKGAITPLLLCVMSLAAAVLVVKGLMIRIELAEQSDLSVSLRQQLDSSQEENRRLRIRYESGIDLDELEDYAKNELGMQRPDKSRIKKIDTETQDKAIVLSDSEKRNTVG